MSDKIHSLACPKCGEEVSGPDFDSVADAMNRHKAKRHPAKKAKK